MPFTNFLFLSWDRHYTRELDNYAKYGDNGEIWFGKRAENRIVQYIEENIFDKSSRIIDLGCGNGSLLHCLVSSFFCQVFKIW